MSTADPCRIVAERVRPLDVARKVAVLQAAVAAAPRATGLRGDLADRLMTLDRFEAVLDLVAQWPDADRSYRAQMLLANCRLVSDEATGDAAARLAADHAGEPALTANDRAAALALRAKAERRLGEVAAARATLVEALALDRANIAACKRLAALLIEAGDPAAVIGLTDDLLARGVGHPQVFNARAVAQARLGQIESARATAGFDRFGHCTTLDVPAGYPDIAAFNEAVAAKLVAHPMRRIDPQGSASRATVRVDAPTSGDAPLATLLMEQITRAIADHVAAMPADPHPRRRARPALGIVHGTCAITQAATAPGPAAVSPSASTMRSRAALRRAPMASRWFGPKRGC